VSVGSGARESMPGMMDSVLNLGLNDESTAGLPPRTGDERFAWDCSRRLVQMFGNVVRGISGERLEDEIARVKRERGVTLDTGARRRRSACADRELQIVLRVSDRASSYITGQIWGVNGGIDM
jgi:phosphoenolpyruvate synthase/pyruvate phosphate dikinase